MLSAFVLSSGKRTWALLGIMSGVSVHLDQMKSLAALFNAYVIFMYIETGIHIKKWTVANVYFWNCMVLFV
jgi:hypothetical protein